MIFGGGQLNNNNHNLFEPFNFQNQHNQLMPSYSLDVMIKIEEVLQELSSIDSYIDYFKKEEVENFYQRQMEPAELARKLMTFDSLRKQQLKQLKLVQWSKFLEKGSLILKKAGLKQQPFEQGGQPQNNAQQPNHAPQQNHQNNDLFAQDLQHPGFAGGIMNPNHHPYQPQNDLNNLFVNSPQQQHREQNLNYAQNPSQGYINSRFQQRQLILTQTMSDELIIAFRTFINQSGPIKTQLKQFKQQLYEEERKLLRPNRNYDPQGGSETCLEHLKELKKKTEAFQKEKSIQLGQLQELQTSLRYQLMLIYDIINLEPYKILQELEDEKITEQYPHGVIEEIVNMLTDARGYNLDNKI